MGNRVGAHNNGAIEPGQQAPSDEADCQNTLLLSRDAEGMYCAPEPTWHADNGVARTGQPGHPRWAGRLMHKSSANSSAACRSRSL